MKSPKLQTKLFIYFLASISIPVLICWVISSQKYTYAFQTESTKQARERVNQVAQSVDLFIHSLERLMHAISENQEVDAFLSRGERNQTPVWRDNILQLLHTFSQAYPGIAGIMILSADGRYLSNELVPTNSNLLTSESWYKQAIEYPDRIQLLSQPVGREIHNIFISNTEEIVSLVKPINARDGTPQGVIMIDLQLKMFQELCLAATQGQNGAFFILDAEGRPIYSSATKILSGIKKEWLISAETITTEKIGPVNYRIAFWNSPYTGWKTVGAFSRDDLFKEAMFLRYYSLLITIICLLTVGALSLFFARSLIQPAAALKMIIAKAAENDSAPVYNDQAYYEVSEPGKNLDNKVIAGSPQLTPPGTAVSLRPRAQASVPQPYTGLQPHITTKQRPSAFVLRACKYIAHAYMSPDLSLEKVARKLQVSAGYLSRLLKQETGYSFIEYLTQVRIRKAVQLLEDPAIKVGEVAEHIGYRSQHYFSRAFKRVTGFSPVKYRQSH